MLSFFSTEQGRALRLDLFRAALLAMVSVLIWCTVYNRWTVEDWQVPLSYAFDPNRQDTLIMMAWIKGGADGHLVPFHFSDIPELGAPYVANWNDFPVTEKPLFCLMGWLANGIGLFAAANVAVMLAQLLAVLSFYATCRILNGSWVWAAAGGLIFGFSRFAFSQGLHHLIITYFWCVPLTLLVCEWTVRGEGIKFGEARFKFALLVAVAVGVQNLYYTNIFAQLTLIGFLVQGWRQDWRKAMPGAVIAGTAVAAMLAMNLNSIVYSLVNGSNPAAVVRSYGDIEKWGLKMTDLLVPPPDHRFPLFAHWGWLHYQEAILPTGEAFTTGYMGLMGLAALAWLTWVSLRRLVHHERLPFECWIILWIMFYGAVGGFNGILGTWGILMFRAATRYSIFILCIALMYAARRLSAMPWRVKTPPYFFAICCVIIALWDQSPPVTSDAELKELAREISSDRKFTEEMERRLPANAMVFQAPVMQFPEERVPGLGAYDHFRPYFFSHQLHYTFGSNKGRARDQWQLGIESLPANEAINELEEYGFAAVYINRQGYPKNAEDLIEAFKQNGRADIIVSDRGDLACIFLKPSPQPALPGSP